MTETKGTLGRDTDYLGVISEHLANLTGYATLANELLQNADDAHASRVDFQVRDDALVVYNDASFADCGTPEREACPWEATSGYPCDFHGFRLVGARQKREREDTTGAFGIGFIAVYQITDRPQLLSSGRNWTLHEEEPPESRIYFDAYPESAPAEGTTFVLRWASDPNSVLRTRLHAPAFEPATRGDLLDEVARAVPSALLFLRHVNTVRVFDGPRVLVSVGRTETPNEIGRRIDIASSDSSESWLVVDGNFDDEAADIRAQYGGVIERKRASRVRVATRIDGPTSGLLYAGLPTQDTTGLPFHLQADFYPSTDRKRVILESSASRDFKSQWNRAAIRACARAVASHVEGIAHELGPVGFWSMLPAIQQVERDSNTGIVDESLSAFREMVWPALSEARVAYNNRCEWVLARDAPIFEGADEADAADVLDGLGIHSMHEDLRPFVHRGLAQSQEIGTRLLDLPDLIEALTSRGLVGSVEIGDLEAPLDTPEHRSNLWTWVATRLQRPTSKAAREPLAACAVAPTRASRLAPPAVVYRVGLDVAMAFAAIPGIEFLDVAALGDSADSIAELCQAFLAEEAIAELASMDSHAIDEAWRQRRLDPVAILDWFAARHRGHDLGELKNELASIPIFPAKASLHTLGELALPGNFEDPIGLADIFDVDRVRHLIGFLEDLGANHLSIETYLERQLPRALADGELDAELKRAVITLMAEHLPELKGHEGLRSSLGDLPVVESERGAFLVATEVYFKTEAAGKVLGTDHPFAVVPAERGEAVSDLYRWLGVADRARLSDLEARLRRVVAKPPSAWRVKQVYAIIDDLHARRGEPGLDSLVANLRTFAWLPAKGDHDTWYQPHEIYTGFVSYLFESQAKFLAFANNEQTQVASFLDYLGIETNPEPVQVVDHLLESSANGTAINRQVYVYLSQNADDSAIDRLLGEPCILLASGIYEYPNRLFWNDHPFGRYRRRLGESMRAHEVLLRRLGVRDAAEWPDAVDVLEEIAGQATSRPIDDDTRDVVASCWQLLSTSLAFAEARIGMQLLSGQRVVPDSISVLVKPDTQFFEDRPGVAAKFGPELSRSIIVREAGLWPAMAVAGVRNLSEVTEGRVVNAINPRDDNLIPSRLEERWTQILRCADPSRAGERRPAGTSYQEVDQLETQWMARIGTKTYFASAEEPPGFLDKSSSTFYFVRSADDTVPWGSVAREVALSLRPSDDPSATASIAAAIRSVLAASSLAEATAELDEVGYPPLIDIDTDEAPRTDVEELGGTDLAELSSQGPQDESWKGAEPDPGGASPEGEAEASHREAEIDLESRDSTRGVDTGQGRFATSGGGTAGVEQTAGSSVSGDGRSAGLDFNQSGHNGRDRSGPRYTLRTFVAYGKAGELAGDGDEGPDPVDMAGVAFVLQHERSEGRHATEMPHNNPGFDIESDDGYGGVRYIEVKSMSGTWADGAVALSRTQFNVAREGGDDFWLYVVEEAESDSPVLHTFRDPARRVTQYVYDDGWKQAAEYDAAAEADEEVEEES